MTDTNPQKIENILTRGIEEIFEKESLLKKLQSGKQLRIKLGIDPTGPKIHIGRAFQFWKLRDFQDMGHKIVLIIGDFTAQIGDASDKQAMRQVLSEKEIIDLINWATVYLATDSFPQHLCAYHKLKKGIVIWGKSDPEIYRHPL